MNANRTKLINRAAFEASRTVTHCRSVYDKANRATHIFEPRENDFKSQFRWYYGQLRAAVNGAEGPAFVYRRQVEVIE